jgi:hypothetical protein
MRESFFFVISVIELIYVAKPEKVLYNGSCLKKYGSSRSAGYAGFTVVKISSVFITWSPIATPTTISAWP